MSIFDQNFIIVNNKVNKNNTKKRDIMKIANIFIVNSVPSET